MTDTIFGFSGTVTQGALSQQYTSWLTSEVASMSENLAYDAFKDGMAVTEAIALRSAIQAGTFTLSNLFTAAQSKTGAVSDVAGKPDPLMTVTYTVDGVEKSYTIHLAEFMSGEARSTWKDSGKNGQFHTREYLTDVNHDLPSDYNEHWDDLNQAPTAQNYDFGNLQETDANADGSHQAGDFTVSIDLETLVSDDKPISELSFSVGTLPDGVTFDQNTHQIIVDQNSAAFDFLKKGETKTYKIEYTVTDKEGLSAKAEVSFTVVGTADKYHDTQTFSFEKTDGSAQGSGFTHTFFLHEGFDYSGLVNVSGDGDLNQKNESVKFTVDGSGWTYQGTENGNDGQLDTLTHYAHDFGLSSVQLSDGKVIVTGDFSSPVANGSTANVTLDYDYWM